MKIDVSQLLCHKFAFLAKTNTYLIDRKMKQLNLSRTQWKTMVRFNFLPTPYTQQQLLKSIDIDRAHLTRTLDQLEQRNLLTRTRSPHDKRACHLSLTAEGKKLLKQIEKILQNESNVLIKGLSKNEKPLLDKLIRKVITCILGELGNTYEDYL